MKAVSPSLVHEPSLLAALRMYRVGAPIAALLLLPGLLKRMIRRGGFRNNFRQRFGGFSEADALTLGKGNWLWIRSISVGETLVALKLARALRTECPECQIAISVTTSTGYELAKREAAPGMFVFYNPVDTQTAVHRTLSLLRPRQLILIEGEVWPNLMVACRERQIPVTLANARLSKRSAGRFRKFKKWTGPFLQLLQWVGIPDEEDRQRWLSIGVPADRIVLTGSIKFDHEGSSGLHTETFRALLSPFHNPEAPLLIAGSTHEGEEEILARALSVWRLQHPALRIAIAPRHVERVPRLLPVLKSYGWTVQLRSELPAQNPWDILLLNTTGELRDWYAMATLVFVGKSLTTEGGQNPVEPALAGRAVVFGPHMENFEAVVGLLLNAEGALQVSSEMDLVESVNRLLHEPTRREAMGRSALRSLAAHQGAARRTAQHIRETMPAVVV